jgi:tetratricopeptide (TPR) repeat protein
MAPSIAAPPEKKPGLLTRMNPFRGKPKTAAETNEVPRSVVLVPQTNTLAATAKPVFPRYRYLSPAAPAAGNRSDAERAVAQAMKAERAGNTNDAWQNYHLALAADPSYFEAQYNTALLAYRLRDFKRALTGFETALALKPDSIDTRYNFALALKQADYANDAANELHRILEAKPGDVRAHLTLGNIYAQQFNEPNKARIHYAQVLELEPRHPQASVIRFWLAANP